MILRHGFGGTAIRGWLLLCHSTTAEFMQKFQLASPNLIVAFGRPEN